MYFKANNFSIFMNHFRGIEIIVLERNCSFSTNTSYQNIINSSGIRQLNSFMLFAGLRQLFRCAQSVTLKLFGRKVYVCGKIHSIKVNHMEI